MKLISKEIITDGLIGIEADFLLSPNEAREEQRIMEKIRVASLNVLFGNNIRALHNLDYRRNITLDDGRIITNAWCKNIAEQEDGTIIATYSFKNMLNHDDFE